MKENSSSWHDPYNFSNLLSLSRRVFLSSPELLRDVRQIAFTIMAKINSIDYFIQQNTSAICPNCKNICCINRHGYYDDIDLFYIIALGLKPPLYRSDIDDEEPCQFLSDKGCSMERSIRPFRCNWYFCEALLLHMEEGPARPYRAFIKTFDEIIHLRSELQSRFTDIIDD